MATYPRSATKLLQSIAMLESGLELSGRLLALATSSNSAEQMHIDGVLEILAMAGLGVEDLQNTPELPFEEAVMHRWLASGRGRESIAQDCSGKHAAMLATCVRAGWTTSDYLDPNHPLQRAITEVVRRYTGEESQIGVDGCGAPAHTMSLRAMARYFGRIAGAGQGHEKAVADAFRQWPEYVSGPNRWECALHRAVPGLICKIGAEASFGIGLPDGRGIGIRIDDGSYRALPVLAVAALGLLGIESAELNRIASVPILGGARQVGEIESRVAQAVGAASSY